MQKGVVMEVRNGYIIAFSSGEYVKLKAGDPNVQQSGVEVWFELNKKRRRWKWF